MPEIFVASSDPQVNAYFKNCTRNFLSKAAVSYLFTFEVISVSKLVKGTLTRETDSQSTIIRATALLVIVQITWKVTTRLVRILR